MAFWTSNGGQEPKRNFRFKITMTGVVAGKDSDVSSTTVWWAKKVTKPNFTIAEGKHTYLGHTYYYPGKVEWQEISMTLVDPVTPNAAEIFLAMVKGAGYDIPTTTSATTLGKGAFQATTSIGKMTIEQYDASGTIIEQWSLNGIFIKSLKFGDLDYENDDLSNIEVGIRYDWAECKTGDSNFFTLSTTTTPTEGG